MFSKKVTDKIIECGIKAALAKFPHVTKEDVKVNPYMDEWIVTVKGADPDEPNITRPFRLNLTNQTWHQVIGG